MLTPTSTLPGAAPPGEASVPILSASGIHKQYRRADGSEHRVLRDVSLHLEDREFVSIVGPSGCGKTTLLRICAGLIGSSAGTIEFQGAAKRVPPALMGYAFQQPALLPWRTVLSNVLLPADMLGLDRKRSTQRARELLELVGLPGIEKQHPHQLSGGMQQRVAIARSLLHEPRLLFMDEPFGALDAMTREELNAHLQEVHRAQGVSILFVTHSIQEAIFLSDRVLVLPGPASEAAPVDLRIPLERPRTDQTIVGEPFRLLESELRLALEAARGVPSPGGVQ